MPFFDIQGTVLTLKQFFPSWPKGGYGYTFYKFAARERKSSASIFIKMQRMTLNWVGPVSEILIVVSKHGIGTMACTISLK